MVDTQFAPLSAKIAAAIKQISNQPVRFIVNTHVHQDHTGGSLNGMVDGLGLLIATAGPNTKIVPGHGPTVSRAEVMAHRDMIVAIRDRVAQLVAQGKTQDEVMAAHPTADYDAKVPNSKETTERFVTQLYAELKK